jgi:mono/diheme cytochrome c family protein
MPRPVRGRRPAARLATGLAALAGLLGLWHDAAAQGASRGPGRPDESPAAITAAMIALGDSIFHGRAAGGACFMCHGADAKGTPGIAPDLTDAKWLHGDGSYAAILRTVENGVPDPKESPDPMPPMGGARLTPAQVRAVAAYVYALSHPEVRGRPQ